MNHSSLPSSDRPSINIKAGRLRARLAKTEQDILAVQHLRYQVFYEEMGARPQPDMVAQERDFDQYDPHCDHLMLIDEEHEGKGECVVGSYRLIQREVAEKCGGFYTEQEFNIDKLLSHSDRVLELGRGCIEGHHRNRPTMQLLWQGVATYMNHYHSEFLFGCASFPGIDATPFVPALSYLHHYHLAPEEFRAKARPESHQKVDILPKEDLDARRLLMSLPPLLKGYIRMGGRIGDGAVIDYQFNTTDVCIIIEINKLADRYYNHYVRRFHVSDQEGK